MTKLLHTGCIKEEKMPAWKEYNLLLEEADFDEAVCHLFVVDIRFNEKS